SGNHFVVISDAAGCTSPNIPVNVAAGAPLNVTIASLNTSCNGAANGSITLTPTNGNAPYQYVLNTNPAQVSNVFSNLLPATYTMSVTDANGCAVNNLSATILAGASLTATIAKTDILCNGQTNGSLVTTVQAPGTAPFQYSLDNINFQASNAFNALA